MQILKSYAANPVRLGLKSGLSIFLPFQDSEADVLTNTEKTSNLAWQCVQIQFWLSLFLDARLKKIEENLSPFVYNMQLTTTSSKRFTCYCLEMSQIKMIKCLTAWHQVRRTLKMIVIENKLISPRQLDRKRHNYSNVTYSQVGNSLRPV